MIPKIIIALSLAAALQAAAAEPRAWRSADGKRSLQGEFVSRNTAGLTIKRRSDFNHVTIPFASLHPDDLAWLEANHPVPGTFPPPITIFDHFTFGESRAQVLEKLKASKIVEATVAETFFGRTGLNGIFRTRGTTCGLGAMLYFDWDENAGLKEITLRTTPLPASDLKGRLIPCWQEFIKLLTSRHGEPVNAKPELDLSPLKDGGMIATHLWKLENNGSALIGASRAGGQYEIAVRFTSEDIKPVLIPAPKSSTASQSP